MKAIALGLLFLTGCTTLYEDGKPVMRTMGDMTNVNLETPRGTKFRADVMNHSVPIRAVGSSVRESMTVPALSTGGLLVP